MRRPAVIFTTWALVGIAATVLDWLVLVISVRFGVPERWAIVPAFMAGVIVQFVGNQRLTFRAHANAGSAALGQQIRRFVIVETGTLVLNYVGYNLLREILHMDYRIARVVAGLGVYLLFSLPMWHWVFAKD